MIYYKDMELVIRNMEEADAQIFTDEYTAQGWHPDINGYLSRLKDQADEKCVALTAVYQGHPAQRMYVKRGYIPDGSGVWYHDMQCIQYETVCTIDDDLVLYLSKKLSV